MREKDRPEEKSLIELETPDGKIIAYVGPHPSLLPAMKAVVCPLLDLTAGSDRSFSDAKKQFEFLLRISAEASTRSTDEDWRKSAEERCVPVDRLREIYQTVNANKEDLSAVLEYRNATVEDSIALSGRHFLWGATSISQEPGMVIPVLEDSQYRHEN